MNPASQAERWRVLMDETVNEVFATMLGVECIPAFSPASPSPNTAARIRFSGALNGECILIFAGVDAEKLARMLLGEAADDAMIGDAVGELCNVLAGGWKRRLRPPASGASLSVPMVERGELDPPNDVRGYQFDDAQFAIALTVVAIAEG
jgi:chemotaxis protein CheX